MLPTAPQVEVIDENGKLVTTANASITLALGANPGGATLSGTTTAVAQNGIATFPGVILSAAGNGYSFTATSANTSTVASQAFNVAAPLLTLTLPTPSIAVGAAFTGTVAVSVAQTNPVVVSLSSSAPSVNVTPNVTIPAGQTSAVFSYTGESQGISTVMASASSFTPATAQVSAIASTPTTLRAAAAPHHLLMGAAADADEYGEQSPLIYDPQYAPTLGAQYSMLEPENAMKWNSIHPEQNTYNFEPGDALVTFAQSQQMAIRGHNLCWEQSNPDWLNTLAATGSQSAMSAALQSHIQTVVTHYASKVFAWDVVNEAVSDQSTGNGTQMKDSVWYNQPGIGQSGTGYVEQAFRWAHAADPNALLFYNDYGIEQPGTKFQAVLNMVTDFVRRGVPINGVGLQMHLSLTYQPTAAQISQNIQQLTALGLQVHITEMDVALPVNAAGVASATDLATEAELYQRVLTVCLQNPGCTAFQSWGFTDKHSWIPYLIANEGAGLPFDLNYQPKPAFNAMMSTLISFPN